MLYPIELWVLQGRAIYKPIRCRASDYSFSAARRQSSHFERKVCGRLLTGLAVPIRGAAAAQAQSGDAHAFHRFDAELVTADL
jgi:hypothetical protein